MIPPPIYKALSYTWESQELCLSNRLFRNINCTLRPIVWQDLRQLRQLRQAQESEVLWVDSICINQTSTSECSQMLAPDYRIAVVAGNLYASDFTTQRIWMRIGYLGAYAFDIWPENERETLLRLLLFDKKLTWRLESNCMAFSLLMSIYY